MNRLPLYLTALTTLTALPTLSPAQHVILASPSTDESTLGIDPPEIDLIRTDEVYETFPVIGVRYTARPFLPISLQYAYVGDLDNDGQYVEDSVDGPGGPLDVLFVKNATAGPVSPRDVF